MNIPQAIEALLYENGTVIVPALGAFVRHNESAQVNVITNEFSKPSSSLSFDPTQHEENPLLMDYLMLHGELSDEDARQEIATFVADCYDRLQEGETIILEGIGTLSFDHLRDIVFAPDPRSNFNTDSFGLEDLTAPPVYYKPSTPGPAIPKPTTPEPTTPESSVPEPTPSEELTTPEPEIPEPTIPESTTPDSAIPEFSTPEPEITDVPDEETPNPIIPELSPEDQEEEPRRRFGWLWLLLLLLLVGVALWYFKSRPAKPEPPVSPATPTDTSAVSVPVSDTPAALTDTLILPAENTTPVVEPKKAPIIVEVVDPNPESKAFIIGGCFTIEENALNMNKEFIGQGCQEAFTMKRGSKFYVCYGQYPSSEEAKMALPEINEKYNRKAWILF